MKKQFLCILTFVVICISCKKEGIDYVRGTVVEDGTSIPVAGASVYLYKIPYFGYEHIIDSTVTDGSGKYKLKFNKLKPADYFIKCTCKYYFAPVNSNATKLDHGKTVVNFSLVPYAYIKFRFIKTAPSSDVLIAVINEGVWYTSFDYVSPNRTGVYVSYDTIVPPCFVLGNRNMELKWGVKDVLVPGPTTFSNSVNIYINKGDTLFYTFTFN